jgi:tetratricopeptide (TPR) repeat protein
MYRGLAYESIKEYSKARSDMDMAIDLLQAGNGTTNQSLLAPMYFRRGMVNFWMQEWDNAFSDFSKAIELDPENSGWAYFNRSTIYFMRHETAKATADLEMAAQSHDPEAAKAAREALSR